MKKLYSFFFSLFLFVPLIAEDYTRINFTESDVIFLLENFSNITKEIVEYGEKKMTTFSGIIFDIPNSESVLEKYGISGPDRVLKAKKLYLYYLDEQMNNDSVLSSEEYVIIVKYNNQLKEIFED